MPRQKLGNKPAVDVVAAARAVADQHAQGLAAIEIRDGLSLGRRTRQQGRCKPNRNGSRRGRAHHFPPSPV
jgi:hypothetical protein